MTKLTKRNGSQEEFQRNKVAESLRRNGADEETINSTLRNVTPTDGESTASFRNRITTELRNHSPETARRYESSRRNKANRSGNETEGMGEGTTEGTTRSNPSKKS